MILSLQTREKIKYSIKDKYNKDSYNNIYIKKCKHFLFSTLSNCTKVIIDYIFKPIKNEIHFCSNYLSFMQTRDEIRLKWLADHERWGG